jgi:hypothetical protein
MPFEDDNDYLVNWPEARRRTKGYQMVPKGT